MWRLKAWLYGLRTPRGWYGTLHVCLLEIGFVPRPADPCFYILGAGKVLIAVYVDDIELSGSDEEYALTIIEQLKERSGTLDLGDTKFLIGLGSQRNVNAGTIVLTQNAYAKAVLDKFGMADARPAKTPAEAGPIRIEEEEILSPEDTTFFRSVTGSLLYLSRCTRPNTTHSVMVLTRSMSKPGPRAMSNLKRVLRYLTGTVSIGITYSEDAENGDQLTAYVDSDHTGDQDKGYSTIGVVLYIVGGPVDCRSTKKTVVATSTVRPNTPCPSCV